MFNNIFGNMPPVTKNLLLLNVTMYIVTMVLASSGTDLGYWLSAHYVTSELFEPYQIITHMFMHSQSGIFHILFNMLILVMIGAHLERIWGAKKYFIVYFASGLGAFALYNSIGAWQLMQLKSEIIANQSFLDIGRSSFEMFQEEIIQGSRQSLYFNGLPTAMQRYADLEVSSMVGASGALFGLLAGFAILFPNTPMQIMFIPVPIKAKYLIGAYFLYEVYNSIRPSNDGVAHLAHVGGAIVGIIIVLIWRKKGKNFI
jgi:membrane associated rhomboid family serine protease|tara:strand:- start:3536 stop:4309 length:774 start_codon:yes stop_codon:yes gene_type:complete